MKNIDIASVQRRRYETYEKEKDNLIVTKTDNGYSVSNLNKASIYNVTKDSTGTVKCTCKDYCNFDGLINCKHIIAVSKKAVRNITPATEKAGDINNIIKEEVTMSNNAKFNPQNYLMKVKGKDYLEVKYRVHWFRQERPNWDIQTKIIQVDIERGIAIAQADIFDDQGRHRSSGIQMEEKRTFPDYLAKAETAAIGRALANLGYGTLQCFDLEEGRIVDSPISLPTTPPKTTTAPATTVPTTPKTPVNRPSAAPTVQSAGSVPGQNGGKGKGNNGNGGNGKTQIENIIDRW